MARGLGMLVRFPPRMGSTHAHFLVVNETYLSAKPMSLTKYLKRVHL